jgi:formylglycine-generating enzyme required for sulfatase activity
MTRVNERDGLSYVWIPPGTYSMGCSQGDGDCFAWEPDAHQVRIDNGFWIGETEVTQQVYQRVTGKNSSRYKGPNCPVEQLTWNDARTYCEALGMRLPGEAEWEYAARGGVAASRYDSLASIAWYDGNGQDQTHPVATKKTQSLRAIRHIGKRMGMGAGFLSEQRKEHENSARRFFL